MSINKSNMILAFALLSLTTAKQNDNPNKGYNILAIDGGGIRGIISAVCLDEMEKYAYKYMLNNNDTKGFLWEPYYDDDGKIKEHVHMKDMFDMMAGTSTGSILSTALSVPKEKGSTIPKFWA